MDDCNPGRAGMAQDGGTRGGEVRAELRRAVNMPEHDGKDHGKDNPKQAYSC